MPEFDWSFAGDLSLGELFKPGVPSCFRCGTPAPEGTPDSHARCAKCGSHLHTCYNCMFYNGIGCMILQPAFWAEGGVRGRFCPSFVWAQGQDDAPGPAKVPPGRSEP